MTSNDLWAVLRLDFAESLRSRWLSFCVVIYGLLGALFVFVGMRESTLLGFTGMGRVLLSSCHALLLVLPLLALTATVQVIIRARDEGALEFLFSQPIRRGAYFAAVSLGRFFALAVPLVVLLVVLALLARFGFGQDVPWALLGRAALIGVAVLVAFAGLGLAVSAFVKSQAKAVTWSLLLWMAAVAILDFGLIGLMLQWRVTPQAVFALAALNPLEAARIALLSAVEPELSLLGPVGFYLAHRLGAPVLLALGVLWPVAAGLGAWTLAYRRFVRGDVT